MQAMREHAKRQAGARSGAHGADAGMMKERLAAMESVHESFNRLYAALTPEQKAAADKHFSMAGRPPGTKGVAAPQGQPPAARSRARAERRSGTLSGGAAVTDGPPRLRRRA
jgi:hypothetical protein